MDPLSITASTLAVIQSLIAAFEAIRHIKGLPKAFNNVGESLPLVKETLELAQEVLCEENPDDAVKRETAKTLQDCQKKAKVINSIFKNIEEGRKKEKDAKDWSFFSRFYREKVLPMGKAHKVEKLMEQVLAKLKILGINQIFRARADFQSQVEKLSSAIRALSEVEPSLEDSEFDAAATNYTMNVSDYGRGLMATGENANVTMGDRFEAAGSMNFAGMGKTVLMSIVINKLLGMSSVNNNIACVYVYFDYRLQNEQNLTNVLSNLLLQLLQSRNGTSSKVQEFHGAWNRKRSHLGAKEYLEMLKAELKAFKTVYLVVDALDECQDDGEPHTLNSFLQACQTFPETVRMLFTSRLFPRLEQLIQLDCKKSISVDEADIRSYLDTFLECDPQFQGVVESGKAKTKSFWDKVSDTIVEKSQGMFLLTYMHMESLSSTHNLHGFNHELANLMTTPDDVYEAALYRISQQNTRRRNLAFNALAWLVYARRPLAVDELAHAVAIQDARQGHLLDSSEIHGTEEAVTTACAGIVIVVPIDARTKVFRLAHGTAEAYLRECQLPFIQTGHSAIAETCLRCLTQMPPRAQGSGKSDSTTYPIVRYAASHWGHHLSAASTEGVKGDLYRLAWIYASNQPLLNYMMQFVADPILHRESNVSGVHIAAYFGLEKLIRRVTTMNLNIDLNAQTKRLETPLHWAVTHKKGSFINMLIEKNADLNIVNIDKRTALHKAVMANDKDTIGRLLDVDSRLRSLEIQDSKGFTCLRWAAKYWQSDVVEMLLKAEANIDACDKDGYTALRWAASEGNKKLIKMLVRRHASIKTPSKDEWTLLLWAAAEGHEDIIRFLAKRQVNLNETDEEGFTALRRAVDYSRSMPAWLLIQAGADVNKPDNKGWHPLHAAVENCCRSSGVNKKSSLNILWLLLQNQAEVNAPTKHYERTPLHMASSGGSASAVWVLLENGADLKRVDTSKRTALHGAVEYKHMEVIQTLLKKDSRIVHAADFDKRRPLHDAASQGSLAIVEILLDHGADIDAQSKGGITALHLAVKQQEKQVVDYLLERGADIHIRDSRQQTALALATSLGDEAIAGAIHQILEIDRGMAFENQGFKYS
ncbi:hypothetical protein CkaCkLH20_13287 [Colletotrichum karsti]|uniref:Ankyrin repeat protein n=1 Tax=Colletotrichum karsti TaxID=1095194 RepID=A0A9P6HTA6_9PEZI|nr:uncharacterized protein CkaCkLH20_13287 [Colletotrichum karsti]KAF9869242.1 hypothetical protein CkaCkLH20_13287 [Colletotrichum karsti]